MPPYVNFEHLRPMSAISLSPHAASAPITPRRFGSLLRALITLLCLISCLISSLISCRFPCSTITRAHAQPRLSEELRGDREVTRWVSALPVEPPQAQFALRRWELERAAAAKKSAEGRKGEEDAREPPSWLRALGGFMPQAWLNANGFGAVSPASPKELARRRVSLDEHTGAKAPPLSYELSFLPSVQPHGRAEVFNRVRGDGSLSVEPGATLYEMSRQMRLVGCLRAPSGGLEGVEVAQEPSATHSLMLSDDRWAAPEALDLSCLRARCAELGGECFLAAVRVARWGGELMSALSVSPTQQLVAEETPPRALRLLRDGASNYYITSAPLPSAAGGARRGGGRGRGAPLDLSRLWGDVGVLHLLIWSPRSYFTGSWQFDDELISARAGEPEALLPEHLRSEARRLYARLGVSEQGSFQDVLYRLVSWFRAFELGELTEGEGGALTEGADLYRRVMLSQRGVCRHRSYAFTITARALGVPTRLVRNAVHAFVEVRDPRGVWRRVDLGGESVIERFTSVSPLIDLSAAQGQLSLPDGLPEHPGGEEARREDSQRQLREFYEQPPETRSALRATSPLAGPLEEISQEGVSLLAREPGAEEEWERVRRALEGGDPLAAGAAEGGAGAAEVGAGAALLSRLSYPPGALPPLSDSARLEVSLREFLTRPPESASSAKGGAPLLRGAPAAATGQSASSSASSSASLSASLSATRGAECPTPPSPPPRPAPPLRPPRPPLRLPTLTATLARSSETRVSRCDPLRVEGTAAGAPRLRGAVVRLYALLNDERRDLGSWATLSASGRFRLRAQVPADAPLGALRLLVRLEEQGGLGEAEVEVRVPLR